MPFPLNLLRSRVVPVFCLSLLLGSGARAGEEVQAVASAERDDRLPESSYFEVAAGYVLGSSSFQNHTTASVVHGPTGVAMLSIERDDMLFMFRAGGSLLFGLRDSVVPSFGGGLGGGGYVNWLQRDLVLGVGYDQFMNSLLGGKLNAWVGILPRPGSEQKWGVDLEAFVLQRTTSTKKYSYPTFLGSIKYVF